MVEKGGLSVETKHIFPIIKRWLYSEKEIFLRELISNACDAIVKLKRLISLGENEAGNIDTADFRIDVIFDEENKTVTIKDNGIGMTAEEVKKYITQIAISGALEFIEKYEGSESGDSHASGELSDDTAKNGIIGHFGLGFYSSFMVADKVTLKTKSYLDAPAVTWVCEEEGEYEMSETPDEGITRGTQIILSVNEENKEYLSKDKIREILDKYCKFMPAPIYFEGDEPVNDTTPLWMKNPSACEEKEYEDFYHKVFRDFKEPLFHIHINADYPLNFKGILYFPKINTQFDSLEGEVKLYYNQVFVADNIKEIIPEYLLMLKGVLDCPELPLNVSRSYLQNNGYVSKISAHIIKKVGDKLTGLFNTEREKYEGFWQDIKTFIEYGCIRDRKFFDRVKNTILYKNTDGQYKTINEYISDKGDGDINVYYTTDPSAQSVYVNMLKRGGKEVVILDNIIETQFISLVETDMPNVKFVRADAYSDETGKTEKKTAGNKRLTKLFKEIAGQNDNLKIEIKNLNDAKVPVLLTIAENSRRIADLMRQYSAIDKNVPMPPAYEETLVLNTGSDIIQKFAEKPEYTDTDRMAARQLYNTAVLNSRRFTADEMEAFMENTSELVKLLI